jgi:hypothetical protein
MSSSHSDLPFQALDIEASLPRSDPERPRFNRQDAAFCFEKTVEICAGSGAAVGSIASLGFFGYQACASTQGNISCPRNECDPFDGRPAAICVLILMAPGFLAGGAAGAILGVLASGVTAPIAGYLGVPAVCDDRRAPRPDQVRHLNGLQAEPNSLGTHAPERQVMSP